MTAWQVDRTGTRPFDLHSADSPRLIVTARQGCSAWICKHANHPPWPHWLRRSPETCARPCCGAICHPCPDEPLAGLRDGRPPIGLDVDSNYSRHIQYCTSRLSVAQQAQHLHTRPSHLPHAWRTASQHHVCCPHPPPTASSPGLASALGDQKDALRQFTHLH